MYNFDIITKILTKLNIYPAEITRFTTGYCHKVYHVVTQTGDFVLRITSEENKRFYLGSLKYLAKLAELNLPVPKILRNGQYDNVYYVLMSYIKGKDLGEMYHILNGEQKRNIVKQLIEIQKKVAALPPIEQYGYDGWSFPTWGEYVEAYIERSRHRIIQNKIFSVSICNKVASIMKSTMSNYFSTIKPTAFLEDISTKNVLICSKGKLAGVVDIDEMCHGDSLIVLGLTQMALLNMKADTKYIDYWLDELNATETERKAVKFYTLLFCLDFMAEQGAAYDNGTVITANNGKIELLKTLYEQLISEFLFTT